MKPQHKPPPAPGGAQQHQEQKQRYRGQGLYRQHRRRDDLRPTTQPKGEFK